MKLYIPTSSLNLNNILSSESISPAAFYPQRGFGYSNFHKVDLNPFDNSLVLYSQCPYFEIPKSDLENHAMVIEIETSDCAPSFETDLKKVSNEGIYQYGRTIYLNPFSSKIYFFNQAHYVTALSLTEQSSETKLARIYSNAFDIFIEGRAQEYEVIKFPDYHSLDYSAIEFDKSLNRIKGFVVAYVIAANRSVPRYIAKAKHLVNEITNLAYAILNSPDGRGTKYQLDMLNTHLTKFSQLANMPFYDSAKEILGGQKWGEFELLMQKYDVDFQFRNSYNYLFHQLTKPIKGDYNPIPEALNVLNNWIAQEGQKVKAVRFDLDGIGITTSKLTQYEDTCVETGNTREYYQHLINDVFTTMDITENTLNTERLDLATSVTLKVKEYEGDNWEDSKVKRWLNQLRRNIAGQEAFDLQWNKGFISAIAAFLLKGDSHDKLTRFLIDCEIEDGRLAFGFYGCTCGFANMSRVFTDDLFGIEDLGYISGIYKKLYKQLHQVDLNGELVASQENELCAQIDTFLKDKRINPKTKDAVKHSLEIEKKQGDPIALWFIIDTLIPHNSCARDAVENLLKNLPTNSSYSEDEFNSKIGKAINGIKRSKKFDSDIKRAIKLEAERGNPVAFLAILDNFLSKKSYAYKKLSELLKSDEYTTTLESGEIHKKYIKNSSPKPGISTNNKDNNLFSDNTGKEEIQHKATFSTDNLSRNIWEANTKYLMPSLIVEVNIEELKELIRRECKISNNKIIDNFTYVYNLHQKNERENQDVIRHFRNLCFPQDPNNIGSIEKTQQNRDEVENIVECLQRNFKTK